MGCEYCRPVLHCNRTAHGRNVVREGGQGILSGGHTQASRLKAHDNFGPRRTIGVKAMHQYYVANAAGGGSCLETE